MTGARRGDFALEWPASPGPEDRALDSDAAEASLDWAGHTGDASSAVKPVSRQPVPADSDDGTPTRRLRVRVRDGGSASATADASVDELHAIVADLRDEVAALRAQLRQLGGST